VPPQKGAACSASTLSLSVSGSGPPTMQRTVVLRSTARPAGTAQGPHPHVDWWSWCGSAPKRALDALRGADRVRASRPVRVQRKALLSVLQDRDSQVGRRRSDQARRSRRRCPSSSVSSDRAREQQGMLHMVLEKTDEEKIPHETGRCGRTIRYVWPARISGRLSNERLLSPSSAPGLSIACPVRGFVRPAAGFDGAQPATFRSVSACAA
jgi:hypothetical protein